MTRCEALSEACVACASQSESGLFTREICIIGQCRVELIWSSSANPSGGTQLRGAAPRCDTRAARGEAGEEKKRTRGTLHSAAIETIGPHAKCDAGFALQFRSHITR